MCFGGKVAFDIDPALGCFTILKYEENRNLEPPTTFNLVRRCQKHDIWAYLLNSYQALARIKKFRILSQKNIENRAKRGFYVGYRGAGWRKMTLSNLYFGLVRYRDFTS